ncbi:MAG: HAD hydrolase-like protein, partial [Prolixibacteraceae bacterium]|nr:HAD hydrolase-like protein [Prolixibacteraceae bacterium]
MGITINQNTKGLIFDLDGTLSDSLPVHVATWNKVGEEYGFDFDPQIVYEMTGRPTIEFARRVVSQFNLAVSPEEIVGLKQQAFWESTDLLKPVDQVVALVKKYFG